MTRIDFYPFQQEQLKAPDEQYKGVDFDKKDVVDAQYSAKNGITDNPDLCALPRVPANSELVEGYCTTLTYDHSSIVGLGREERLRMIQLIDETEYPLKDRIAFTHMLEAGIESSYQHRDIKRTAYFDKSPTGDRVPAGQIVSVKKLKAPRPYVGLLTGTTGTGKSMAAEAAISLYPRAIRHVITEDGIIGARKNDGFSYIQIPIIYVTANVASMKALLVSIAEQIDMHLDTGNIHKTQMTRARSNVGTGTTLLGEWVMRYHIGCIIIDEIQLLKTDKTFSVFEDIISLMQSTGVALILIGNPDGFEAIKQRPRITSRLKKIVYSDVVTSAAQEAFDMGLKDLWRYQFTDHVTPMDSDILSELRHLSNNNISLLKTIMIAVQTKAVLTGRRKDIDIEFIQSVAGDRSVINTMRELLLHPGDASDREFIRLKNELYKMPEREAAKIEDERTSSMLEDIYRKKQEEQQLQELVERLTDSFMDTQTLDVSEDTVKSTISSLLRADPHLREQTHAVIISEAAAVIRKTLRSAKRRGKAHA